MSLTLVATPIGHPDDLTLRAIEVLKSADLILGEERRELMPFLKRLGLEKKPVDFLNEHSKPRDLDVFVEDCRQKNVALVSDCGTPGFCDPGADLVSLCRKAEIPVTSVPGASSLMMLLSLAGVNRAGQKLDQFVFLGFLPLDKNKRQKAILQIKKEIRPMIVMDTPYRLTRLLDELSLVLGEREALLACDLTTQDELIYEGTLQQIQKKVGEKKAEFLLLVRESI